MSGTRVDDGAGAAVPSAGGEGLALDVAPMRAAAGWACRAEGTGELEGNTSARVAEMRGYIRRLVPEVRALARRRTSGDVLSAIASIGADEAERRLSACPGSKPDAHSRYARKLAMSVISLCDHHENLTRTSTP
jgi:hypothetical protein